MVLLGRPCGRVGRRRNLRTPFAERREGSSLLQARVPGPVLRAAVLTLPDARLVISLMLPRTVVARASLSAGSLSSRRGWLCRKQHTGGVPWSASGMLLWHCCSPVLLVHLGGCTAARTSSRESRTGSGSSSRSGTAERCSWEARRSPRPRRRVSRRRRTDARLAGTPRGHAAVHDLFDRAVQ